MAFLLSTSMLRQLCLQTFVNGRRNNKDDDEIISDFSEFQSHKIPTQENDISIFFRLMALHSN